MTEGQHQALRDEIAHGIGSNLALRKSTFEIADAVMPIVARELAARDAVIEQLTRRNAVLESLGAAAEQTHDEWERQTAVIEQIRALAEKLRAEDKAEYLRDESWFGQGLAGGFTQSSRRIEAVLSSLPSTGETT